MGGQEKQVGPYLPSNNPTEVSSLPPHYVRYGHACRMPVLEMATYVGMEKRYF